MLSRGYEEFPQHFPRGGWVEHNPEDIWQATLGSCRSAIDAAGGAAPVAVGVTNQRETAVLWDRETLAAPRRAIVWQDRRTAGICQQLREDGNEDRVRGADRAAVGPVLHRHQADLARHRGAAYLGGGAERPGRGRHRRLLHRGQADPRPVACHRSVERIPHAAVRHPLRAVVGGALRSAAGPDRRAAADRSVVRGHRPHRPVGLPRAGPAHRRHRGRPAGRAVRPDLLRAGPHQVHLRHRVLRPDEHRGQTRRQRVRAGDDGGVGASGRAAHVCPRGLDLRDRRGHPVAARWVGADLILGGERGAGQLGAGQRRRRRSCQR